MNSQDILILFFEKLFFGFGLSILLVLAISVSKSESTKEFSTKFLHYAISIIRPLGIVYFLYYLISTIVFYTTNKEATFLNERATGPYAWAYWMMLLRPYFFCLFIQLFWIKSIRSSKKQIFLLTLIVFFIVLVSGQNLERFVIIFADFHRDYAQDGLILDSIDYQFIIIYLVSFIENVLLFSGVVFVIWFLTEIIKKSND